MSTDLARLRAALEDRYAIEGDLGEGGMATVYLAQDLKHNRKVAVKVLRPELAAVVGAERFLSEIETTANLQHPHILPLFDSGEADGFLYYVMPYVEGESLREKLEREHQLSVDEAVEITRKVAAALHYAHENGVVHRDVKPANILMSRGEPLVADFGIALALTEAGGGRITETGLSLGTPHYMSPEQAAGERSLDVRSDVYALGCILYEMLTGEPPHGGPTPQAVLARILTDNPRRITELRRTVPQHVDAATAKALEKLPADRFHTAGEFARALTQSGFTHGVTVGARVVPSDTDARSWKIAAAVLGAVALVLGVSTLVMALRDTGPEPGGVLRFQLPLPIAAGAASDFGPNVAISPDGRTLVYSGVSRESTTASLWMRRWDKLEPEEILGTEAGVHPTFSPDGSRVAFITDNRELKVVSLEGRPPVTLHESGGLRRAGLAWGDDGYIYFSQIVEGEGPGGIYRIQENGGDLEQVTAVDSTRNEIRHYFPDFIPGEDLLVIASASNDQYSAENREIAVADVETGEVRRVLQGVQAWWSPTGHILSVRSDGALLAAAFDPGTFEAGPANPVFEGVQIEPQASVDLAVSDNGTLVYVPGDVSNLESRTAVWVSRSGTPTPVDPGWRGRYQEPRISPDGSKLAIRTREGDGGEHVWVKELDTGPAARLTFEGNSERPIWTPAGDRVAFISQRSGGNQDLLVRRSDAATAAEILADVDENIEQVELSPDGKWIVLRIVEDLFVMSTEPGSEPEPLLADPEVLEANFALSPDGRWLAYVSNETGAMSVYVRPFPNVSEGKWPVSTSPAVSPRWSPDGREIFYKGFDGMLMAAQVLDGPTFVVGERRALFPHRPYFADLRHAQYDVHPDGDRFLMIQLSDTNLEKPLMVVENFTREIQGGAGG